MPWFNQPEEESDFKYTIPRGTLIYNKDKSECIQLEYEMIVDIRLESTYYKEGRSQHICTAGNGYSTFRYIEGK